MRSLVPLADDYYECHVFLKQVWNEMTALFEVLSPKAQLHIHQYYRPTDDLTRDQLLRHRRRVTKQRPEIEDAANRAYRLVHTSYERNRQVDNVEPEPHWTRPAPTESGAGRKRQRSTQRQLRVWAVPRAEPDVKLIADAFTELAMEIQREKTSSQHGDDSDEP